MELHSISERNVRWFIVFRVLFNARFYYPVMAILFLDLGLSLSQYALLNVAWAAAIVLLEVPSGAMADLVGRKRLVVFAAVLMVCEMAVFSFTPTGNITLLFGLFLLNRVISGAAEASASGADEALVYDSLKAAGRESEWPRVLERLARWQSGGFFVAMILGAAVYDPGLVTRAAHFIGSPFTFTKADTVRWPVYLTLATSLVTVFAALRLHENRAESHSTVSAGAAFREVLAAGRWIWASPLALFVLAATVCNDSFIRLFLTIGSQYYRLIQLPEATFVCWVSMGSIPVCLGRRTANAAGSWTRSASRWLESAGTGSRFLNLAAMILAFFTSTATKSTWAVWLPAQWQRETPLHRSSHPPQVCVPELGDCSTPEPVVSAGAFCCSVTRSLLPLMELPVPA